ncbi:RNA polymerase sigma factor [Lysobacter silvisoli]|uniref:RNA polymerase sigma factor n=1 Tax=Lysobacter silvisoli TaxID=2293254 RepID=UPI001313E3B2|nr:RNA polymerase sigma factor [Lysobacter silvisoli]
MSDTTPASDHDDSTGADLRWDRVHVQRLRPALLRYFRRHLAQQAEDAEDLAQETLVRLARAQVQPDNAEAYALRIASNLLRDRYRRDRSHHAERHEPLDAGLDELPSEEPGSDHVYASKERLERLLSALDELSPRCRQVFLLQRYEGMTYTAIARQLQVSVSAVEKHMMRALLHLQARLAEP